MKLRQFAILAGLFGLALPLARAAQTLPVVSTAQKPVTNEYHGTLVVDPYQWLEDAPAPPVREWTARQNERTQAVLQSAPLPGRTGATTPANCQ